MLYLFRLEWKKMRRPRFFKMLLLLLILGIASYYTYIYLNTVRSLEILDNLKYQLEGSEKRLSELEKEAQESQNDHSDYNHELEYYRTSVPLLEKEMQGLTTGNWVTWAKSNSLSRNFDEMISSKQDWESTYPTRFTLETHQSMLVWFAERNIEPIWPSDFWITKYDEVFDEGLEPIIRGNFEKRHASNGSYFSYHLFEHLFTFIGVVFFLFLFSDIVTKEGEGRNGPIHLLRTQPMHKDLVLFSKFCSVFLMTLCILLGVFVLTTVLGTVFDRFGDWDYPILIYDKEYAYQWMPLGWFLLKSTGLFILILLFSYSLLFFFSVLTNRAIISIGITLTLLILGINWAEQSVLSVNAHFLPFHYLNVFPIVSNEYAVLHDSFEFSYQNGVFSLMSCSIILLFFTYVLSVYRYRTRG